MSPAYVMNIHASVRLGVEICFGQTDAHSVIEYNREMAAQAPHDVVALATESVQAGRSAACA